MLRTIPPTPPNILAQFRSPEEWSDEPLDEQIDAYSFGNVLYVMLTGLEPFYAVDDDGVVQDGMIGGETPFIDERYRTRSYEEGRICELLDGLFKFDPSERTTIFEAVRFLREAVEGGMKKEREESPSGSRRR